MKFKETISTAAMDYTAEMKTESKYLEDIFQVQLYNSGIKLLSNLDAIESTKENAWESYDDLREQLVQLRDFQFEIGFAGGMSSGKSTVINSLIEYPLMPTCKLTTTCVGTHIFYGEKPRITVVDDDTGREVLKVDCTNISQTHFQKLKEYACVTTHFKVIENLQYFTSHNIFQDKDSLEPDMLQMNQNDPNQVIILMMILLTVYVDQNSREKSNKALAANKKRQEVLRLFNFPEDTFNYTIQLQWNGDFLKSGITITDLPGLGAYAPDKDMGNGKMLKGHDSISTDAIKKTDAMVFLVDPQVDGSGVPALQVMISSAHLKEAVKQSDLVIPVLNKVDDCQGKSEVDQAVDKFVDILKNTGVDKRAEDIHLYSAWYGEYKFAGFSDDRTCFFFRNYEKFREDIIEDDGDSMSEGELHCAIMEKSRKRLAIQYKKSGIDEFKRFFRRAYIAKIKNGYSQAAVLAARKLALDIIHPIGSVLDNLEVLYGVTGAAIHDISKGLKTSVDAPIAAALNKNAAVKHNNQIVQHVLDGIPELYISAFEKALEEYKDRNTKICGAFSTGWLGFSDRAQIDKLGTENQLNYSKLCEEMDKLGVDVKKVNESFRVVLNHVTQETEDMYSGALEVLEELKDWIAEALDQYEERYKKNVREGDPVLRSVAALKNTLVHYTEHQIDVIIDGMKANHSNLAKAGNDTVNKILDLNTSTVNSFIKSVVGDVKSRLSTGGFFSKKEYIRVTGSGGVLEIFKNLSLSSQDSAYIKGEIQKIGIVSITNNLDRWYQETENAINKNFTQLRVQLIQMMDNTVKELQSSSGDLIEHRSHLRKALDEVKSAFVQLRRDVQKLYAASLSEADDDALRKYEKNIFCEIMDLTEEEKAYEETDC